MKLKECSVCGKPSKLWKSSPATCAGCIKKKPISKISLKQKETLALYKPLRAAYIKEHPECEAKLRSCSVESTEIHHLGGKSSQELYLDPDNWLAVCRSCHSQIEEMGGEVYDLGLKVKRNIN